MAEGKGCSYSGKSERRGELLAKGLEPAELIREPCLYMFGTFFANRADGLRNG